MNNNVIPSVTANECLLIILAAGKSSRLGFPKGLLRLQNDKCILEHNLQLAITAKLRPSIVAVRAEDLSVYREVISNNHALPCIISRWEPFPRLSLLESLKMAFKTFPSTILFIPVDCAISSPKLLHELIDCVLIENSVSNPPTIAKPVYEGRGGHPVALTINAARTLAKLLQRGNTPLNECLRIAAANGGIYRHRVLAKDVTMNVNDFSIINR